MVGVEARRGDLGLQERRVPAFREPELRGEQRARHLPPAHEHAGEHQVRHGPGADFRGYVREARDDVVDDLLEGGTIHLLDLALWFMGPVASLHAVGRAGDRGVLESAVVNLAFASGAVGLIVTSASAMSFKPWERGELIGDHAVLVVDDQFELTLLDDENGPAKVWRPAIPNTLMMDEQFGGYAGLLEHVLDAVRGLVPLTATGRDGAAAVALVDAIHESIRRGGAVELEPPAERRAWPVESKQ